MYSVGVDIGGTFTDFTVYDHSTGAVHVEKRLTTPNAPESAVLSGLQHLQQRLPGLVAGAQRVNHATTLVANAILERKGLPTALLTTGGFRDILETRLEYRYNVYDLFIRYPEPIVPRHHRYSVSERLYSDGEVHRPLVEAEIEAVGMQIAAAGIRSVAICFLHAYRNPAHEQRAAEILRNKFPGISLSISHEVNPEPREYQRSSTTVLDAYVKPLVHKYLTALEQGLAEQGYTQGLEIMLSNGGSATAGLAREFPIQMIESGPAAGVEAAIWMCRQFGITEALSFDMGGTTAKLCILRDGLADRSRAFEAARVHRFIAGSGFPVSVPVYDLVEIGAGGGSIAQVDNLGLISVGPESAGADPGPACYDRGGAQPTVTDADLVLGLIDPDYFLGGDMQLDAGRANAAIEGAIGRPLGLSVSAAAYGIYDIVNETMASAARLHIAEKGCDPSRLTLIAFGGAGPLHATELARKLGCPSVLFPPHAGVMSSFGLLTAPPAFERMVTVKRLLQDISLAYLDGLLTELRTRVLSALGKEGKIDFRYIAEMWHSGQEFPIEVGFERPSAAQSGDAGFMQTLLARFRERYAALYGRTDEESDVELVALRAIGTRPEQSVKRVSASASVEQRTFGERSVYDPKSKSYTAVPVLLRERIAPGATVLGPAVVQDRESGIVIRAGDSLQIRDNGAIFVTLGSNEEFQA